ncbi:hypothetical protein AX768_30890 (plasmid) [Burkholderia sp. PAMC 28687]|jgi:hypothetical protein|uniref:hypothetical protein n=1 Tax=Burkholderia sp. PAMC 28687 TaxID=1795874 RepID=UPI000784053A|nr:hypothetical protein [Burkholderia sp. PAMC 28687]AMM18627.1 hypothetical protein AX768_30890 [Burkholderia sp. PAMC 28687]
MDRRTSLDNARKEWISTLETALQEIAIWKSMLDANLVVLRSEPDPLSFSGGPNIEDYDDTDAQQVACSAAGNAVAASREKFFSITRTYKGSLPDSAIADIGPSPSVTIIEIYRSSNGDRWDLQTFALGAAVKVRHIPNAASGGEPRIVDLADFLEDGSTSPQVDALRELLKKL